MLNPTLYKCLKRQFREVKFANEGEPFLGHWRRSWLRDRWELHVEWPGEQMRVNCPFCSDTTHRLYVSHRYLTDLAPRKGVPLWQLVLCWNEDCQSSRENREALVFALTGVADDKRLLDVRLRPATAAAPDLTKGYWPGPTVRIDLLPPAHPARTYLEHRGFDVGKLGRFWDVRFVRASHMRYAHRRILFPTYFKGELRCWQTRYVGELDWKGPNKRELPPKYFTMPHARRSLLLHNFDHAIKWRTAVIVEGPMDCVRVGPMAVSLLGKSASPTQRKLLKKNFESCVLLLDPEEYETRLTKQLVVRLRRLLPTAHVKLPRGSDPGSLGRPLLRQIILKQAQEQRVPVFFEKKEAQVDAVA